MSAHILCVDDEVTVLNGLQRSLRKQFAIDVTTEGAEALRMLKERGPYAVIVADMRMPGMNGVELLSEAMRRFPETVRIMLTGNADQQTAVEAVNKGHIFRFLNKPCSTEDLTAALWGAMEQHHLIVAERELLERTLGGSVSLLTDVLSLADAPSFGMGQVLRGHMRAFGLHLELSRTWDLEMGAMLSQIGCVTIPPQLLHKWRNGEPLTRTEQDLVGKIPEFGADLLGRIPRLETVTEIVRYQDKHFDGTGYPRDGVAGEDIPVGARILKVLSDLNRLEARGVPRGQALERMREREGWYDPDVLDGVGQCLDLSPRASVAAAGSEVTVRVRDLNPGSRLLEDLRGNDDTLVAAAQTVISPALLDRLRNFSAMAILREPIRVLLPGCG